MTSKKLLAYHTVEKYRHHYDGVWGVGMIGIATHHPVLATVSLLGWGYITLLNHAVFKGLLFLGAGSVNVSLAY